MSLFLKTSAVTAALASAALLAPAAVAQQPQTQPAQPSQPAEPDEGVGQLQTGSHIIVIGAIRDPSDHSVATPEDVRAPELPVVYEDARAPVPATAPAAAAPPASPARR